MSDRAIARWPNPFNHLTSLHSVSFIPVPWAIREDPEPVERSRIYPSIRPFLFSKYRMVCFKYPFVDFPNHDDAGRNPPTPSECRSADCEANELTKKVKDMAMKEKHVETKKEREEKRKEKKQEREMRHQARQASA